MKTFLACDIPGYGVGSGQVLKGAILPQAGVGRRLHAPGRMEPLRRCPVHAASPPTRSETMMKLARSILLLLGVALASAAAWADEYDDTVKVFKMAGESGKFFDKAHGYAVFPTIGKGG